jgi:hypothetical protein
MTPNLAITTRHGAKNSLSRRSAVAVAAVALSAALTACGASGNNTANSGTTPPSVTTTAATATPPATPTQTTPPPTSEGPTVGSATSGASAGSPAQQDCQALADSGVMPMLRSLVASAPDFDKAEVDAAIAALPSAFSFHDDGIVSAVNSINLGLHLSPVQINLSHLETLCKDAGVTLP